MMNDYGIELTKAEVKYANVASDIVCAHFKINSLKTSDQSEKAVAARKVFVYLCGTMNVSDTTTSDVAGISGNYASRIRRLFISDLSEDEKQSKNIAACEKDLKLFFSDGDIPWIRGFVARKQMLTRVRKLIHDELPVGSDAMFERELRKIIKRINKAYGPAGTNKDKPHNVHNGRDSQSTQ